jgi:ABC-type nitrate/sulfonate/bicarbonate transport system substrate-binding protein
MLGNAATGCFAYGLFGLALVPAARAYGGQPVRLALISEGIASWPLYVARAKELFEREGVTVEETLTASSARQLEQLTKGGYDIGFQQSDHVVRAVERGSDLFIFMATAHPPGLNLVVAPGIGSFADLKGRIIAVDGARSGYALLLRKLLAGKGLKESDYTFREFGGSRERFEALKGGHAFASFLNPPFDRNLFAEGFKSLGTTRDYFPTYPGPIAAARRSWARDNQQRLVAFIRGMNAAFAWLADINNKNEAIEILRVRLRTEPDAAARAFDRFSAQPRPTVVPDALRQVIDIVWDAEGLTRPQGAPDKYMDLSYLRKATQ